MSGDTRTPDAPGIGGPPSEPSWYDDEPEPISAGPVCETQGCGQPALAGQSGCIMCGACDVCDGTADEVGPLVVRSDGIARCVSCALDVCEHCGRSGGSHYHCREYDRQAEEDRARLDADAERYWRDRL